MEEEHWEEQLSRLAGPPTPGTYWSVVVWEIASFRHMFAVRSPTAAGALVGALDREGFWESRTWEGAYGPLLIVPSHVVTEADVAAWHQKYG